MLFSLSLRYVCSGGSTTPTPTDPSEGYLCPTGHFCPEGSDFEQGCPINTYQGSLGQADCDPCPAGYMCPYDNMTIPLSCKEGLFSCSFVNVNSFFIITDIYPLYFTGYYCLEGIEPIGCPAGTYNNMTGISEESQCTDCSPGSYCEGTGNIIPTGE